MLSKTQRNKRRENYSFLASIKGNTSHYLSYQYMASLVMRHTCSWKKLPIAWKTNGNCYPHKHRTISKLTWVWPYSYPLAAVSNGCTFHTARWSVLVCPLNMAQESFSIKGFLIKHNHASNQIHKNGERVVVGGFKFYYNIRKNEK